MNKRLLLFLMVLLAPGIARANATVSSTAVDAVVNQDGSVSLFYQLELSNASGSAPVTSIPISLPSSQFQMEQVRATRCDAKVAQPAEQGGVVQVEQEGREEILLQAHRDPDPQATSDIVVDLGDHAILPGEAASLCVSAVVQDYVSHDPQCLDSAYVSARPTLYYGNAGQPAEIFVAIHLPPGVSPKEVLAQQEWPQDQIQASLPVQEENGQAVVRWHTKAVLSEVYWIAAIFPSGGIKLKKAFDGLQTDYRLVPLEVLSLDAYVQNDATVRLVYELEIDNSGSCKPVDIVQFVLPGRPEFMTGSLNGKPVPVHPTPTILDGLMPYVGHNWYEPVDAVLGTSKILPQQSGIVRLETRMAKEIELLDPDEGLVSLTINPTASASGTWKQGSHWTTRIHLPPGISESEVQPVTTRFMSKETVAGQVVLTWEQTTTPSPVDVSFPIGRMPDVQWNMGDPHQWLFVLKHHHQFPETTRIALIFLTPILLIVAMAVLVRVRRRF